MIIAHTVKGKGNRETEKLVDSHNVKIPDQATYARYMAAWVQHGAALLKNGFERVKRSRDQGLDKRGYF